MTIGDAQCCAFINGVVNTTVPAIIDSDNGVRLVHVRVPPRDGTIFTHKDEQGGRRVSILCDLEERRAVEDDSSRIPCSSVLEGRWDRYDQVNSCSILVVKSGNTGAVIADPNRAVWRDRHSRRIDKI